MAVVKELILMSNSLMVEMQNVTWWGFDPFTEALHFAG